MEKHDLKYLPIDKITPNSWNPQTMDDLTFNRLVEEIRTVGFIAAMEVVAINDGTYRIIGGEHRWRAAKIAGLSEVPCLILKGSQWKEDDLQKFVTVRLNCLQGHLNPDKFLALYQEMVDKYGEDSIQDLFGYVDSVAFQKLVSGVKKGMKKALPKDLHKDFDLAAKEAKTVEDLEKIIQEMFAKYGDTLAHSFMIFTHGKQEHIYILTNTKMKKTLDSVLQHCKDAELDINDFLEPLLKNAIKVAPTKKKEELPSF